jgi:hypothetical protein
MTDAYNYSRNRPSRIRKAWCELTGGHDNNVNGAFTRKPPSDASLVQLECKRCGKRTMWYKVPSRSALSEAEEGRQDG